VSDVTRLCNGNQVKTLTIQPPDGSSLIDEINVTDSRVALLRHREAKASRD
jgi:hypothetical protein